MEAVVTADRWSGRNVLITGHTGFSGAWLAFCLHRLGARVTGLALPPPGATGAHAELGPWDGVASRHVDLRDRAAVAAVVADTAPDLVFHLAAQAIVGRAAADPLTTYDVNVMGTVVLLEALGQLAAPPPTVVVTTDKVYAPAAVERPRREDDPLGGQEPYSTSKVMVEHLIDDHRTSGWAVPMVAARAGNLIGGGDLGEGRLVPDVLRAHAAGQPVVLRHPAGLRPWQHVLDAVHGYLAAAECLAADPAVAPRAVNLGPDPDATWTVERMVSQLHQLLGGGSWHPSPEVSFEEAPWLLLDPSLARHQLGWSTLVPVEEALEWTVEWHVAGSSGERRQVAERQLERYQARR